MRNTILKHPEVLNLNKENENPSMVSQSTRHAEKKHVNHKFKMAVSMAPLLYLYSRHTMRQSVPIKAGTVVNAATADDGMSPLYIEIVVKEKHLTMFTKLIAAGDDVNTAGPHPL
tara:strand:+ start:179 stop:523 length:345 start_codon:yes stop_codon:yes gene_type:complete